MKRYTGAEWIVACLERSGVGAVYGLPGGAALPLYDALERARLRSPGPDAPRLEHVLARHEQGAGFMAQGRARITGDVAVCLASSGPGATNLVTAIADAHMDSVPIIVITGQVPTTALGTDAFQEIDVFGLSLPITKSNHLVHRVEELIEIVPAAFETARGGRPGPVWIDVPKDVQNASFEITERDEGRAFARLQPKPTPPGRVRTDRGLPHSWAPQACIAQPELEAAIQETLRFINISERPVLYVGGGVRRAQASQLVRELAERARIPVAMTLHGLGILPPADEDPWSLGMLGMHGAPGTNRFMEQCDLLLAFGVRFDDRATGDPRGFCPQARVVHVDLDPAELGKIRRPDLAFAGDVGEFLRLLLAKTPQISPRLEWEKLLAQCKATPAWRTRPEASPPSSDSRDALALLRRTAENFRNDAQNRGFFVTTDVGQHQMWAAQVFPIDHPEQFLTSGGLGTMGFGLPAAIGAGHARPELRGLCISGDGSILLNIQELAVLAELDLDLAILVLDNRRLGLVSQQQELFYENRLAASRFARSPDLVAIARGFGVDAVDLEPVPEDERFAALEEALRRRGPRLIRAPIIEDAMVLPMVPPGRSNAEMIGAGEEELAAT